MDTWKYYDITHRDHAVCNPVSVPKLHEVIALLDLPPGGRVLDIASGKGELLVHVAEAYGSASVPIRGTGVDISPYCIASARELAAARVPRADLEFVEADAATYANDPDAFDLACCLGGSFALGGYRPTLRTLRDAVRPGGQVLVGEPYWHVDPDPAYLAWSGMSAEAFGTHAENIEVASEESLAPLLAYASNLDEWDRYETLQWRAAVRYAEEHPDDPDVPELLERVDHTRHEYLHWGRETLGWALYLFRRP
jgi:SAM-dependent methyltransferase